MRDHLATLLDDFRRFGREIAVVRYQGNRRRVTSYGELARLAGRFAALLVARGIKPGDRVLLWGENSAEWIAAFHGCMLRGVLAVPLDATGTASLAGLNLNTANGLPQFLITLNGAGSRPKSVTVKLTWTATYDPSCIKAGTLAAATVRRRTSAGVSTPAASFSLATVICSAS